MKFFSPFFFDVSLMMPGKVKELLLCSLLHDVIPRGILRILIPPMDVRIGVSWIANVPMCIASRSTKTICYCFLWESSGTHFLSFFTKANSKDNTKMRLAMCYGNPQTQTLANLFPKKGYFSNLRNGLILTDAD